MFLRNAISFLILDLVSICDLLFHRKKILLFAISSVYVLML